MARSYAHITNVLIVILFSLNVDARPINVGNCNYYVDGEIYGSSDILGIEAIKVGGGPSEEGKGHEFPTAISFGNIKNSGPSPGGKGHEFTQDKILGYIKNSGPSPGGKGHGFHDAETFGNIKNSGPSSGGKGHDFTTIEIHSELKITGQREGVKGHEFRRSVETLGNILNTGSRLDGKADTFAINSKNLWDLKNSGPSHGGEGH